MGCGLHVLGVGRPLYHVGWEGSSTEEELTERAGLVDPRNCNNQYLIEFSFSALGIFYIISKMSIIFFLKRYFPLFSVFSELSEKLGLHSEAGCKKRERIYLAYTRL